MFVIRNGSKIRRWMTFSKTSWIVLPAAALQRRWEGGIWIDDRSSYGLGLLRSEEQGLQVIGHGGNTFEFSSDMYFIPEFEIVFGAPARAEGIVAGASRWAKSAPERLRGYLKTGSSSVAWLEELMGEYYTE